MKLKEWRVLNSHAVMFDAKTTFYLFLYCFGVMNDFFMGDV